MLTIKLCTSAHPLKYHDQLTLCLSDLTDDADDAVKKKLEVKS